MTMKKKYIVPQTEVIDIKMENTLLAGSAKGTDILGGSTDAVGLSREEEDLLFGDQGEIFKMLLQ